MTGGAQDSGAEREAFIRLLDACDRFNGVYISHDRLAGPYQGQMILAVKNAYRVLGIGRTEKHEPLTATPAPAGWMPIETCDTWRFDHMTPMIAYWPTRGPRETYYDVDEEFHLRPKGWASPEEGWRSPGDQCIPIESHQPTHWREFPAAPTAPAEGGV